MQTTRREFVGMVGGIFGAALLPTWTVPRPPLDLASFCGERRLLKMDLTTPFAQRGFTYATDARVIIRVPGTDGADKNAESKRPDAGGLWWRHDQIERWYRWPSRKLIADRFSSCPECGGRKPPGAGEECDNCEGEGKITYFAAGSYSEEWHFCEQCHGRCWMGTFDPCPACGGHWDDARPACQQVGSLFIAGYYDRIIRALPGVRFAELETVIRDTSRPAHVLLFRSDAGEGILCPIHRTNGDNS